MHVVERRWRRKKLVLAMVDDKPGGGQRVPLADLFSRLISTTFYVIAESFLDSSDAFLSKTHPAGFSLELSRSME